jgi:hypothetical protein
MLSRTLVIAVILGTSLLAQQSASITGTVLDKSGAAVPGAKVVATSPATQLTRETQTNESGSFALPLLPPGAWTVAVTKDGFRRIVQDNLILEVNQSAQLSFSLEPGQVSETVEVNESVPLIDSTTSSVGQVVETRAVQELPLNGRNFVQLATLGPGVVGVGFGASGTIMSGSRPDDLRPGSEIFSNGNREGANNFLLDGIDNNERLTLSITLRPSVEAVREFKIQTNMFAAEQGRNPGATVNVVTKSGSNEWHGSAYNFVRNDNLDARNFFTPATSAKPQLAQNQFGASFGGKIIPNRVFFFANYEGYRRRQEVQRLGTVPLSAVKQGNFASYRDVYDPLTTRRDTSLASGFARDAFPNRIIPSSRWDSVMGRLIQSYPAPNNGTGIAANYAVAPKERQNWDQGDLRVDYNLSSNRFLFGRISRQDTVTTRPSTFPITTVPGMSTPVALGNEDTFAGDAKLVATHAVLNYVQTLTPALVMEAKLGFQRFNLDFTQEGAAPGARLGEALGVRNSNQGPRADGIPIFSPAGYFGIGQTRSLPILRKQNTYHPGVNFTWVRNHHSFKWGAEVRRRQLTEFQTNRGNGRFNFDRPFSNNPNNASATGDAMASALLGTATVIEQDFLLVTAGMRAWESGLFFQDDWRVNDRLTLNLGLRWENDTPYREVANRWSNFDITTGRMLIAGVNAGPTVGVLPDRNNFAPRLGMAYKINNKTILRGGGGVFYGTQGQGGVALRLQRQQPYGPIITVDIDQFSATPRRVQDGLPTLTPLTPQQVLADTRGNYLAVDPFFRPSYTLQYNLQLQRELMGGIVAKVGYVGNVSRDLDFTYDINSVEPGPGSVASRRPFRNLAPNVQSVNYALASGKSHYQSLQATAEKRFAQGLSFLTSYTWSHLIDNVANSFGGGANGPIPQDIRFREADRGSGGFDIRHRFVQSVNYDLPIGKGRRIDFGNRFANNLIGNWQTNLILTMQTGLPFTPTIIGNPSNAGTSRPNVLRTPQDIDQTVTRWFDTSLFSATNPDATWGTPAQFTFGNAGRNILTGPGRVNWDVSLFKNFDLLEKMRLQYRAEFFNMFNTPQLGIPNATIGDPNAGRITGTAGNNRQVQMALRLTF